MRLLLPLLLLTPGIAVADPGHLGTLAGHDHWVAGAAIGLAVLAGLWGALKGRGKDEAAPQIDDEPEEQPA